MQPARRSPQAEVITGRRDVACGGASAQASGEVSTIGVGSLIGIILLMWLTFRSVKPIALILLSIGIGCLGRCRFAGCCLARAIC
jgi:predicted exporter